MSIQLLSESFLLGGDRLTGRISRATPYIQFNEHIEEAGAGVFKHACKLGLRESLHAGARALRGVALDNAQCCVAWIGKPA
jgi:hypothetical protein